MKECKVCGMKKPLSLFYRHPRTKDGFMSHCMECRKAESRAYYHQVTKVKEPDENLRQHRWIVYRGERRTLADWSKKFKLHYDIIWDRLNAGWPIEEALETPVRQNSLRRKR